MPFDLIGEAREELRTLTPEQRSIVLGGLRNKLGFHRRTGILSYRYDVCPVCQDVGSTEDDPKCDECYIKISCKVPFTHGFRDDPERGVKYFAEMLEYLEALEQLCDRRR
jgi:hypothetical protein